MRCISEEFKKFLKEDGEVRVIFNTVKGDSSLDCEIRKDRLQVYYRGSELFSIVDKRNKFYFSNSQNSSIEKMCIEITQDSIHKLFNCLIPEWKNKIDLINKNELQENGGYVLSNYKVIRISCRKKDGDTASYIIQNGDSYDQIKVPQKEISYERGDIVDTKYIDFFKKDKLYKDYQKINCREKKVCASNLIEISNFIQQSYKDPSFLEEKLLWGKVLKETQNPDHSKCAGKISDDTKEKTICRCMYHYNAPGKDKSVCKSCSLKPKWRNISSSTKILEYEFPTTKKYENVGGMDLIFEYEKQIYACEIKPENSDETLARMFAEILTYTLDTKLLEGKDFMKGRKPTPAIGFFENSKQHKAFDQYKSELKETMDIICGKISIFIIKTIKNKNGITDFKIEPYK